jgi:hypothetical protein
MDHGHPLSYSYAIVLLLFDAHDLLDFVEVRINAFIEQIGYDHRSKQWEEDVREEKKDKARDEQKEGRAEYNQSDLFMLKNASVM